MRLLVCGNRNWTNVGDVSYHLALLFPSHNESRVVIHGNSGDLRARPPRGADVIAGWCAKGVGATVEAFPVDHDLDGPWPAAGPRRNTRMLRDGKPDRGLAFGALWKRWTKGGISTEFKRTGTGDTVSKLLAAGLPARWVASPGAAYVDLVTMPEPT